MDEKQDWVWLEHPETGGKAQFPPPAAGLWRAKGWFDTTPAAEPNRLKDPVPESELVAINEPVEAPTTTQKTTKPAPAGDQEENSRG